MDERVCPWCGFRYADLRTGLTYGEVYLMLWSSSEDSSDWRYKHRNTVLGKWHQIKLELWERHLDGCRLEAEELDKVPF